MVAVPCHGTLHDLPVHAVIGGQIVLCRPLFKVEQVAEKLVGIVFRKQLQTQGSTEMAFEQRGGFLKIGQHSRGVGGMFRGFPSEGIGLGRFHRQAPMQIDAAKACCLFEESQPVIHENLRDRVRVMRFPRQIEAGHDARVFV